MNKILYYIMCAVLLLAGCTEETDSPAATEHRESYRFHDCRYAVCQRIRSDGNYPRHNDKPLCNGSIHR